jgi:Ca2+-binding RTX toxin-like protein
MATPAIADGANVGDNRPDVLFEQPGDGVDDRLVGLGGDDRLRANFQTGDRDIVIGGLGNDTIHVDDGDALDTAIGGPSFDICWVDHIDEAGEGCELVQYG